MLIVTDLYSIIVIGLGILMGYTGRFPSGTPPFRAGELLRPFSHFLHLAPAACWPPWPAAWWRLISRYPNFEAGHWPPGLRHTVILFNRAGSTGAPSRPGGNSYLSLGGLVFDRDIGVYYLVWLWSLVSWPSITDQSRTGRASGPSGRASIPPDGYGHVSFEAQAVFARAGGLGVVCLLRHLH